MKKIRLTALFLVVVMLCGCLAGCGGKTAKTGIEYDYTETEETIEYTFFASGFNNYPDQHDAVLKFLEEKFNIKINLVGATADNWQQRLAALIADNKTPDLFFSLPDTSTFTDFIKKEVIVDLNAYIEHGGDELSTLSAVLAAEPFGDNIKINDKNYFVPYVVGSSGHILMVRKDWMKQWNAAPASEGGRGLSGDDVYKQPTTLSEFTSMVTYFHTANLSGGNITYGMAMNPYFDFYRDMMGTFGIEPDFYIDKDGNYQYSVFDEKYEDFIKWFQDGDGTYIYDGAYAMTEAEMIQAFIDGKTGVILSNGDTLIDGLIGSIENMHSDWNMDEVITLIQLPDSDDGSHTGGFMNFNYYWGGWAMSADAKEPMRLVRFLDYILSEEGQKLMTYGIKDVHYTESEDGVITPDYDARNNDGGFSVWLSKGNKAEGYLLGRYSVGSAFIACPFKVENGKIVENYPLDTSGYPTFQKLSRELCADDPTYSGLRTLIADPEVNKYKAKILDAIEQYTISRISGTSKEEAMELLESTMTSNRADDVLEYLNENNK